MSAPPGTQEQLQTLMAARNAYQEQMLETYDEVLREVATRIETLKTVGKSDIGALLFWKRLRADTRWVRELMTVPDAHVRETTAQTVVAARDGGLPLATAAREARVTLNDLPGFGMGDALASAVIFACAPERMAVYDRRAHRGMQKLIGVDVGNEAGRYGRYMSRIAELVEVVNASAVGQRWIPRDVDLALFMIGKPEKQ